MYRAMNILLVTENMCQYNRVEYKLSALIRLSMKNHAMLPVVFVIPA